MLKFLIRDYGGNRKYAHSVLAYDMYINIYMYRARVLSLNGA